MFKERVRALMNTKLDDYFIQFLIVLSLVLLVIETEPGLTEQQLFWLHTVDKFIVIIFTFEYLLRLWLDGKTYAKSFYGIIDILAILPYYISLGAGFQSIRVFRLFRLLRLLKLARYTTALDRIVRALNCIREELFVFTVINCCFMYAASVLIYHFEHLAQPEVFSSIAETMWWAVITFTTIGYGDVYPITAAGRLATGVLALGGLGVVAIPTGLISAALTKIMKKEGNEA